LISDALRNETALHVIVVVPRFADSEGRLARPSLLGRERAVALCRRAGGDRFGIYDVENHEGTAVYVHAKVVVVDDTWSMAGSDNLNRRSWTHDSELSVSVLDSQLDGREPADPAGVGDGARLFARELRLQLLREHLDRSTDELDDLVDPTDAAQAVAASAARLDDWHDQGCPGEHPPGRLRPHTTVRLSGVRRIWALILYRFLFDPDGRAWRDKLRRRG
jgi:phosphatidylserine/phosphatidylglycerophosphate/cardiolipin synthase-like enzyme